jgi:regulatory protein YycI of two-component signal transduction system YycFG
MDWSRIKTIFIISFLLLDIYLAYQLISTRDEANYEFMKEASLEEKLKNDDITYSGLPQELVKERYVSVRQKVFKPEDLSPNQVQKLGSSEGAIITGYLENPVKLTGKFNSDEFMAAVRNDIKHADQYRFWEKNDDEGTITYYQQYEGKTMYHNLNAKLTFYINEQNEVDTFEQTFLEVIEELSDEQEVLAPLSAIETLYKRGFLKPRTEITKVELGYSTLVQLTASQVLAPTWRIVVNGEENLFVHAFEGQVIQLDSSENQTTE